MVFVLCLSEQIKNESKVEGWVLVACLLTVELLCTDYRRHILWAYKIAFFRNNSGKLQPIGTLPCKLLAVRKTHFANSLVKTTLPVGRFPWNLNTTWIGVVMNSFGTELQHFFDKGHLLPKTSFLGFFGTLPVHTLQYWPFSLERIWALHLTVEEPKVFPLPMTFSCDIFEL